MSADTISKLCEDCILRIEYTRKTSVKTISKKIKELDDSFAAPVPKQESKWYNLFGILNEPPICADDDVNYRFDRIRLSGQLEQAKQYKKSIYDLCQALLEASLFTDNISVNVNDLYEINNVCAFQ